MKQSQRFPRLQRAATLAPLAVNHLIGEAADALYVHSGKRIDATRPRRIYGLLNERCNLKCLGCQYWRLPAYAQLMSADQWMGVLAELRDFLGRYHINFSGGEPLLRRDLFEILNYCRDNGIHAGLTTNGVLLKERQARELVDARLFSLNVSIDGAQAATHDEQRGVVGSFDKAVGAIRLMRAYAHSIGVNTPIIIKPMVSALNLAEMPTLVELAADLGCSILFQPVSDWGTPETDRLWVKDLKRLGQIVDALIGLRQAGHPVMNSAEQMRDWTRHFQRAPRVPDSSSVKCTVGLDTLIIMANGELRHCYKKDALGKVGSAAIQDIWRSEGAREIRTESLACTRGCTESCTVKRPISQLARGVIHLIRST